MGKLVQFPGVGTIEMSPEQVAKLEEANERSRVARETIYVDTKDTAKLIRAKLKVTFPNIKFGVKISRYSMGSSIYITWTDGPTDAMVRAALEEYRGDYFDGMTDYHGGLVREVDGKHYRYAGSISTQRSHSDTFIANFLAAFNSYHYPKGGGLTSLTDWSHRDRDYAWRELNTTMGDAEGNVVARNVKVKQPTTTNIFRSY